MANSSSRKGSFLGDLTCRRCDGRSSGGLLSSWYVSPSLGRSRRVSCSPCLSQYLLAEYVSCTICGQTMCLCVLSPSRLWVIECRVQSDPEHHPVCLMHGEACISTHCFWACSYTLITGNAGWGGRAAGLLCSHDCAVLWQKESERWETERESGGSDAEERSCKYRKLHRLESGGEWQADRQQQAVSRTWEVAANSAEHWGLGLDYRQYSQSERQDWRATEHLSLSIATGRGVDTAGQVAIAVWTTQ